MVDRSSPIQFEDIPLDEARRMGCWPRIDPEPVSRPPAETPILGQHRCPHGHPRGYQPNHDEKPHPPRSCTLGMPVTIRKVPGGLLFWPSTDEDRTQANEIAQRLPSARKPPQTTRQKRAARSRGHRRAPARAGRSS
jgi:hypothetical protein